MRSSLVSPCKFSSIALVVIVTLLLSGWTCTGLFVSCQGVSQAQINSLSPDNIPSDSTSVPLTVDGNGFTSQSQILWNGSTLETTFIDSHHLQTTITQEIFDSFGGSAGNSVRISVASGGLGCPIDGNAATLDLMIN
ncbi:MAG: hypothetical protein WCB11_12050 [Terriglobales bacterium]